MRVRERVREREKTERERMGRSPGLVVMGGDSCTEGRGFGSWHHILERHFSQIFIVNSVLMFA